AMRIRHGRSLAEALAQMNALPRPIRDMLAAAERSGSVEASTATAAEHAAQERDAAADTVVAGSAAGALALGAVITLIALAIAWRNLYEAIFERAGV
ncbi:MAG: type II secretion system F family protein, partial [Gemmatimonadota bacterium]|nr:type II secretion system F family protein [Gemmatimonadota bacterium]